MFAAAFHKLKTNCGSMTKGIELSRADIKTFANFQKLLEQILNRTFNWSPVRIIYVPKPEKKKIRPLGIVNFYQRMDITRID